MEAGKERLKEMWVGKRVKRLIGHCLYPERENNRNEVGEFISANILNIRGLTVSDSPIHSWVRSLVCIQT